MNVLIISSVWVEPQSSAAGSRMLQLIGLFLSKDWKITYASTASPSEYATDLTKKGIDTISIALNDASFDVFIKDNSPDIVLFDRFMVEEQFGWRVAQQCPDALRILDTEDLHCLRKARHQAVKENRIFNENDLLSDIAKREIASIYRCDLTLMISEYEMELLQEFFKVPRKLLHYLPFVLSPVLGDFIPFEERAHFIAIGNFLHAPNWDATLQLKKVIWPEIRKTIPDAQLHVYGAYASEKVLQLHNPKEGFYVKRRAEDAIEVISKAKVLLAPLRFGAGLKGKFIDAMQCGTPSVTTQIGAEAMQGDFTWGGAIEDDVYAFAKAATALYTYKNLWKVAQDHGRILINNRFQRVDFEDGFYDVIMQYKNTLTAHRQANFTGQMLLHHTLQSTKYLSKWIEEKNKKENVKK
ncbi:glycosyl transferase [Dokdonia pacifica]|uniref:Glycosyl transferases group 1 n=1 Tax=Dokdonia pacifica TaxID=1627892 RepID=A0A239BN37_9FLAO|nr:glycosyltransferase family 4 protein [Dokdonia pacifica]GGG28515.1 glycosyl transferase [Dokdonia pacifica]SNS09266.1 Glycosyl transferases group 1 [Dokdonia pacifica]